MRRAAPILITGSHRSGTTWVGRMIAASPSVFYIHEPFSLHHDTSGWDVRFDYWFTYVYQQNEKEYYKYIKDLVEFRFNLRHKLGQCTNLEGVAGQLKKYTRFTWYHLRGVRPILKDPIALFSAEWLFSRFNMDVVVMIRHPAAFVASIKEKNWTHPFSHFMNQPALMREYLQPFERTIIDFCQKERDIIDQASLLWNLTHYVILKYRKNHPDWIYMRHEDLSRNPVEGFRALLERLGVDRSEHVLETVKLYSMDLTPAGVTTPSIQFPDLKRDSNANIKAWKSKLTPSEIKRIRLQVGELSKEFYSEDEW
jgi:hypothetical protein